METELKNYLLSWKRKKGKKFRAAVEKAAEEMAVEMFIDLVKKYEETKRKY